jgi:phosphopantetheinyl transferase (holo-ACP synthase)
LSKSYRFLVLNLQLGIDIVYISQVKTAGNYFGEAFSSEFLPLPVSRIGSKQARVTSVINPRSSWWLSTRLLAVQQPGRRAVVVESHSKDYAIATAVCFTICKPDNSGDCS